jgi:hypothetical protein
MAPTNLTVYYSDGTDDAFDQVTYRVADEYLYVESANGAAAEPIDLLSIYTWVARSAAKAA